MNKRASRLTSLPFRAPALAALAALALLVLAPLPAVADQPQAGSGIQVLRASELGKPPSQVPGSPHTHVTQPADAYGGIDRYGHAVNGPNGDIVIWSPRTGNAYGSQPRSRLGTRQTPRQVQPMTGPKLEYKPDYGKPKSRRD